MCSKLLSVFVLLAFFSPFSQAKQLACQAHALVDLNEPKRAPDGRMKRRPLSELTRVRIKGIEKGVEVQVKNGKANTGWIETPAHFTFFGMYNEATGEISAKIVHGGNYGITAGSKVKAESVETALYTQRGNAFSNLFLDSSKENGLTYFVGQDGKQIPMFKKKENGRISLHDLRRIYWTCNIKN